MLSDVPNGAQCINCRHKRELHGADGVCMKLKCMCSGFDILQEALETN